MVDDNKEQEESNQNGSNESKDNNKKDNEEESVVSLEGEITEIIKIF